MLNPFFLNGTSSEQGLLQSLMTETIQMHGVECYYLPRSYATTNTVIREVVQSEFNNALSSRAYVESYDGYGGQGDILSKFGIQGLDDLEITISRERFESYISPLMKDLPDMELTDRPKEGDLIWFPLGDRLFEIKFVEHEQPFYQLKERYVYQLKCELFRLEDEVLDTNVSEIDESIEQLGHIFTLNMLGVGRTATATAGICTSGPSTTLPSKTWVVVMISNLTLESLLHQLVITQLGLPRSLTFIPIATENMVEKLLLLTSLTQVAGTHTSSVDYD